MRSRPAAAPTASRELGKLLQDKLGQPGYTLLFITSTFVTVAATDRKLPYDVVRDFTPIAMLGRGPLLNIGPPDDLATVLKGELEGWRRVVREGGLKID